VFYIRHKALVIQEIGDVFRDEVTSAWYRGELLKQRLLLWKNVRGVESLQEVVEDMGKQ
jgi:hypothetical protein